MFCEFLSKFYVVSLFILLISNASSSQSISWSQINNGIVDLDFMDICVNNQDYIFVCTWYGAGLYRSTNGGANWTLQSSALPANIKTCEIDISSNGTLFFGGRSGQEGSSSNDYGIGIYKSTDNGNSWAQTVLSHGIAETIATGKNGLVFVGFQAIPDYYDLRGIHRSTDYGVTWTHVANASEIFYVTEIAIHPNNDIYAGTYQDGLFRSLDNGNTWSKINGSLTKINSIVFNLIGEIYVGTGDNGVFKSTDNGNTWSQINNGLNNLNVEELVFNSKQELFAGTYGSGVYYSGNSGASWYNISDGLSNKDVFCLTINSNSELFAGTLGGGIYKSTNTTSVDETQINYHYHIIFLKTILTHSTQQQK